MFVQSIRQWFYAQNPLERWYLRNPLKIYHAIRRLLNPTERSAIKIHKTISNIKFVPGNQPRVLYLHRDFPGQVPTAQELVHGGSVKYVNLDRIWPHAGVECNLIYGVSSAHSPFAKEIVSVAKERGIKMVWNQNGVWVPEAYPPEMVKRGNQQMSELLHSADYVFYQSLFCKLSADHFLGHRDQKYEILYNAVDTSHFTPGNNSKKQELILLIAGSHIVPYRLPIAIQTLSLVCEERPATRLLIAGQVVDMHGAKQLTAKLALGDRIEFIPPYNQKDAPDVYRRADMLLHTKYNDPCPTVVIEAMSCGLPVVYSKTGGVPELVGDEAGYGVDSPSDWYVLHPPDPKELAIGVLKLASKLSQYQAAARDRAVNLFDYKPWLKRHAKIFTDLLAK